MEVGWLALAVSVIALAVTLWNTRRAVKKDSVFWVQRDKVSRGGQRAEMWRPTIYNYGHGTAGDVRVFQMHDGLDEPEELSLTPTVSIGEHVAANLDVNAFSNVTLGTLRLIVRWREAPTFKKDRSETFRFPADRKHEGTGEATGL